MTACCLVAALAASCGGGSSGTSSSTTSSSTQSLTATVSTPTAASANIAALVASGARPSFITETPAAGLTADLYNLSNPPEDGEPIGEATTGTDGTVSFDVDPDEVDEGDQLLLVADDDDADTEGDVFMLVEMPAEGDTVDLGDADLDQTLAWQSLLDQMEDAGVDLSAMDFGSFDIDDADLGGMNVHCYMAMQHAQWEFADPTGDGLDADVAMLEQLAAAAMIGDYDVSFEDLVSGDVDDAILAAVIALAAEHIGGTEETYLNTYDEAIEGYNSMADVFEGVFADPDDGSTSELGRAKGLYTTDGNSCAALADDAALLEETMQVMLGCGNATDFGTIFGSEEGFGAYSSYMGTYYTDDAMLEDFNPDATLGIIQSFYESNGGNWSLFPDYQDDMYALSAYVPDNLEGSSAYRDWGASCGGQVWDAYEHGQSYDDFADQLDDWSGAWAYMVGEVGFDPDSYTGGDYDYFEGYGELPDVGEFDYSICASDPSACASSFDEGDFHIDGFDYAPPPPEGYDAGYCGDFSCDFLTENTDSCSIDCAGEATGPGAEESASTESCSICMDTCSEIYLGGELYDGYTCTDYCTSLGWCGGV